MANFSIENLRSPRSPRRSSGSNFFYPESGVNSGASTPYVSAPSSPRGYYYYYSAPPTPPRNRCEDSAEIAVPFSWEAKPGTPKAAESGESERKEGSEQDGMKTSVDHLTAIGFHFSSAPVSPQREFDFMNGNVLHHHQVNSISKLDEFEFSSARMSDADSVVSHADELFFQGQILPLKLPPRLQQKSSLSVSLQLQDHFSPKSGHNREFSPTRSPRGGGAGGSRFVHQLHSPKTPKSGFSRPPAAYGGYPKSPRSKSPSKLVKGGSQDENKSPSKRLHPQPTTPTSSIRRTLKELLHINTSKSATSGGMRKQESVNLMGTESQRSSRSSSSSSSQRFSDSRSSSVSSTKSGRSSFSSKQVSPAPHDFMQSYNRSYHKPSNADELRRRTFLPYKQGLLGCLSCISAETFQEIHELRNQTR